MSFHNHIQSALQDSKPTLRNQPFSKVRCYAHAVSDTFLLTCALPCKIQYEHQTKEDACEQQVSDVSYWNAVWLARLNMKVRNQTSSIGKCNGNLVSELSYWNALWLATFNANKTRNHAPSIKRTSQTVVSGFANGPAVCLAPFDTKAKEPQIYNGNM